MGDDNPSSQAHCPASHVDDIDVQRELRELVSRAKNRSQDPAMAERALHLVRRWHCVNL